MEGPYVDLGKLWPVRGCGSQPMWFTQNGEPKKTYLSSQLLVRSILSCDCNESTTVTVTPVKPPSIKFLIPVPIHLPVRTASLYCLYKNKEALTTTTIPLHNPSSQANRSPTVFFWNSHHPEPQKYSCKWCRQTSFPVDCLSLIYIVNLNWQCSDLQGSNTHIPFLPPLVKLEKLMLAGWWFSTGEEKE